MKKIPLFSLALLFCLAAALPAQAHFGMIIPSKATVMEAKESKVLLDLKFWHPFENEGMDMAKPASFKVFGGDGAVDLLPALKEAKEQGRSVWSGEYNLAKPGLYVFAMEPQPYFEPAEDCFIVHYTKVCVDAFGDDEGWNEAVGQKAEIVPLSRPGALYAGNVFQGRVLLDGKPVPGAEVEVEWYPGPDKKGNAPYESMVTQTVMADDAGIFTYAAPVAGWWGFAALMEGEQTIARDGEQKAVEIGAVFWAFFHDMKKPEALK